MEVEAESMPILDVEIVTREGEVLRPSLAREIASAAAAAIGSSAGSTWVRLHELPAHAYAEDGETGDVAPVFVSVLKARVPSDDDLVREVERLTAAVAGACERPRDSVHVLYEPPAHGRIAFGGKLVR